MRPEHSVKTGAVVKPAAADVAALVDYVAIALGLAAGVRVVVITEDEAGVTVGHSSTPDVDEIRGLLFRAATALPARQGGTP
jgi:hypothetical protein